MNITQEEKDKIVKLAVKFWMSDPEFSENTLEYAPCPEENALCNYIGEIALQGRI